MHNDWLRGGRGGRQEGQAVDFDGVHGYRREARAPFATIARLVAGACIAAIAALSLAPGDMRPHTFLSGRAEHFIAYAGTGLFLALGALSLRQRLFAWTGLAVASGVFEMLQSFVPGRSPNLFDGLASTSGLTLGMGVGVFLAAAWSGRNFRPQDEPRL